ncbi:MAG TPA: TonB-dependent receptor [Chitinophagaceae bacterium]
MKGIVTTVFSLLTLGTIHAQESIQVIPDTSKPVYNYLTEITIVGRGSKSDIQQMPEIVGTSIYAGKKSSLVVMDNVHGNIVTNNMRQIVAKIPGIHIWESDGSGIQIGIAARGLSPNRSWEFNVRQNGYDISSDPYGYPEAYYNPQLQAVQRIQIVRGSGALQYGPQFGGMINYILRNGSEINKPFEFETQQTVGSFGLFNTYNAVGGETKKLHYYAFFDHRNADGWRENSRYKTNTGFATFTWKFSPKVSVNAEFMRYNMESQQPGGLTDSLFAIDPQKSYRSRNWFSTPWTTAALSTDIALNASSRLNVKLSGMWGDRNSIGYLKTINVKDTINAATLQYNNRELARDKYRNFGIEGRYLTDYNLLSAVSTFSAGLRYFKGNTYRLQRGKGDTGSDYNTDLQEAAYPTELDFDNNNAAVFAENVFRLTRKLIFIPGIRFEHISSVVDGRLAFNSNGTESRINNEKRTRNFVLFGAGAEYHITKSTEFYANYTQAYRPMLFTDLSASPTTDVIDPDLEDAKGYNIDLGYRGKVKDYLFFDLSGFYLKYNDRIGTLTQQRADGSFYNYRTNVGNSISKGFEGLVEFDPVRALNPNPKYGSVSVFTSYAYTNAKYGDLKEIKRSGNSLVESTLKNNKVENAPEHIIRAGITYNVKGLSITYQLSHVSEAFSNANNTVAPTADGNNGLIPAYTISDISINYKFLKNYNIRAGINNVADASYFTRRAGGYPGPGLMPADGRSVFLSVGAKL